MGIPGSANPLLLTNKQQYLVQRSLRFNSSDSAYCGRTPASSGNRRTFTWSGWVKRSGAGGTLFKGGPSFVSNPVVTTISLGDQINITQYDFPTATWGLDSVAVFRDYSAWYHIVVSVDTTQATASDRVKVYVNNVLQSFTQRSGYNSAYPAQNSDTWINSTNAHEIGSSFNGYLADIHFIDGQALTPSSFAETNATTGQWVPKAYTGSYNVGAGAVNGFKLNFADNSNNTATTLGKDTSGNGNNWTPNNLSVTAGAGNDSLVDTPSSAGTDSPAGGVVTGNYCTLNPLDKGSGPTLANGNLDITGSAGVARGTMYMPSGKWYFEGTLTALGSGANNTPRFGVANAAESVASSDAGSTNNVATIICSPNATFGGRGIRGGTTVGTGNPFAAGDVAMVAYDADTGNIWFGKNGSWINGGNPATGATPTFTGLTAPYAPLAQADTAGFNCNFGQRPFAYTAPSGFKALCDTNLPAPLVAKPSTVMDVKLYTGNGSTQTISGLGFSPDLVWLKERNTNFWHNLYDIIRGPLIGLTTNSTNGDGSRANTLTSFDSTGFTLGNDNTDAGVNRTNQPMVAWCWDAGSSNTTNTSGTITSTVRTNGYLSIATYTGTGSVATVGHGLGVTPGLIIIKRRNSTGSWPAWHSSFGNDYIMLNDTIAKNGYGVYDVFRAHSSTTFGIGVDGTVNTNTGTYVAYCFAPVVGYSSFGSYVGNGSSTDGPFVYTGFRPRWLLIKNASVGTDSWQIWDAARSDYNAAQKYLLPNTSGAEGDNSAFAIDFTSNGFKVRNNNTASNGNTNTLVYACFAESPFAYARAR